MYEIQNAEGWVLLVVGLLVLGMLTVLILFLLSLQKALQAISEGNRKMPPGQVWLLLIPLFNIAWTFVVVIRLSDSFRDEFARLNITYPEARPTFAIGMAEAVLTAAGLFIPDDFSSGLGNLVSLANVICWIIYWVKVVQCRRLVEANRDNELLDAEKGIFHGSEPGA